MYLEKGIEEFGKNHKPSPFTIACQYCGGWAMDVSGIQEVPGGGYVPLPDGYSYFANVGNRDCGVPTFPKPKAEKLEGKEIEILIADEINNILREKEAAYIMTRVAGCAGVEAREIGEVAKTMAEWVPYSAEEVVGALLNVIQAMGDELRACKELAMCDDGSAEQGELLDFTTAWDRKEAREKLRAVERAASSRFSQYRTRESAWATRKRTGPRRREWRGPWKEN